MGGSNCESPAGEAIARHVPDIDYVFSGPGLASLQEFVQAWLDGDRAACDRIDGVFSKANCGAARSGGLRIGPPVANVGRNIDINQPIEFDYDSYFEDPEKASRRTTSQRFCRSRPRGAAGGVRSPTARSAA